MELHGDTTRGMTVCDVRGFGSEIQAKQPGQVDVVVGLDVKALKELFAENVLV